MSRRRILHSIYSDALLIQRTLNPILKPNRNHVLCESTSPIRACFILEIEIADQHIVACQMYIWKRCHKSIEMEEVHSLNRGHFLRWENFMAIRKISFWMVSLACGLITWLFGHKFKHTFYGMFCSLKECLVVVARAAYSIETYAHHLSNFW